jgi:hypothetical protein
MDVWRRFGFTGTAYNQGCMEYENWEMGPNSYWGRLDNNSYYCDPNASF